ncbi:energy transducer TonB [Bradyrhizobium macuxiense]|uniref:energy transducer TonB n=1 Tax=Bradyrhizobium macuxiense TaxID=1755647 RepID=UPI0011BFA49A|nr:energy transducer TonB [Bradyrhizobium macuxiense]
MSIATADHFNPPHERSALPVSFAAALLVEGLCVLAIVGWLTQHPARQEAAASTMQISLETVAPTASEAPADPPPMVSEAPPAPEDPLIPPPPTEVPPEPTPPQPETTPPPEAPRPPPKPEAPAALRTPKPPPQAHRKPAARPAQQQAAASAAPSAAAMSSFQGQLRRAVESALIYPTSARASGQHGRARVTFDYLDGRVSAVSLAQSSGSPVLDQAAIATVRSAHYPLPPPEMSHRTLHLGIFVEFKGGM